MNFGVLGIVDQVRDLAARSDSVDFSEITVAIEAINTARAQDALRGIARLEAPKLKVRPFTLAYVGSDGDIRTAKGVEFPMPAKQAEDDEDAPRRPGYAVLVDDYCHPFYSHYKTMAELREYFERRKAPYYIAYAD